MIRDSEKSRKNWELGHEIIGKYLKGENEDKEKVKIALAACSIHSRTIASESNMETNRLVMAKLIYSDPEEMKKYMAKSMPQMMVEKK